MCKWRLRLTFLNFPLLSAKAALHWLHFPFWISLSSSARGSILGIADVQQLLVHFVLLVVPAGRLGRVDRHGVGGARELALRFRADHVVARLDLAVAQQMLPGVAVVGNLVARRHVLADELKDLLAGPLREVVGVAHGHEGGQQLAHGGRAAGGGLLLHQRAEVGQRRPADAVFRWHCTSGCLSPPVFEIGVGRHQLLLNLHFRRWLLLLLLLSACRRDRAEMHTETAEMHTQRAVSS